MTITRTSITSERAKRQKAEKRILDLEAAAKAVVNAEVGTDLENAVDALRTVLEKPKKPA